MLLRCPYYHPNKSCANVYFRNSTGTFARKCLTLLQIKMQVKLMLSQLLEYLLIDNCTKAGFIMRGVNIGVFGAEGS